MLIVKSKPKTYLVEHGAGKFTFQAPNEMQEILLYESLNKKSFSSIVPLVKELLIEVVDVEDQDKKPLGAKEFKTGDLFPGWLILSLITGLFTQIAENREAEAKN